MRKKKRVSSIYAAWLHVTYWVEVWRASRALGLRISLGEVILSLHPAAQKMLRELHERHGRPETPAINPRSLN